MEASQKSRLWQTFFLALAIGAIIFLPFLLYDKGYFIYYGDFNVQQIPFYQLAHRAVRSGDVFWSWYTDLGANFIGSYSFYLLFSPFFWLTLLFPNAWLPFLMAPLLVLKTACAAFTAYLFLRRFVRDTWYAVIGSLLYAFSGWMSFNIFFNHFHEVAVFFPLLLLGVERLVEEDKAGFFAFAVMINAMVNYWFFVGEAVFVVLYILVRRTDKTWHLTWSKFFRIALEAVMGVGCAALVLVPSVMSLMGNPRTGTGELLSGWNVWLYWHEQRQPAIIQSLLFPPELPARPNFLPDHGAKWASLSGWLPLLSVTGVLAYFMEKKDDWLKKLLAICLVFSLVPALNNLFILLNDSYYARWFYMPILFMSLATVRALESSARTTDHFARAVRWSGVAVLIFAVMSGLTPRFVEGELVFGLANDPNMMWIYVAITMTCLLITAFLVLRLRKNPRFPALVLAGVMAVSVGFNVFYLANGKYDRERSQRLIDRAINGWEAINLPDEGFARTDVYDSTDNIAMYWRLPNIQAFHSIVPPSIMEFYPQVGVTRDVGSRPEAQLYALRPLLSVRWLFIEADKEKQDPMPGYVYYDQQNGFNIYENENYLPMGFAYDRYVTPTQMEDVAKDNRSNLMLRAVVLDEDAASRNSDLLLPLEADGYLGFDVTHMQEDVTARWGDTADSFTTDRRGFTATASLEQPRLLFFSVPYEAGWSARLITPEQPAGAPLFIEKGNLGFMAVRVPAGEATIRFDYFTPGLKTGLSISAGTMVLLLGYTLVCRLRTPNKAAVGLSVPAQTAETALPEADSPPAPPLGQTRDMSWEEYKVQRGDKSARTIRVEQALQQAADKRAAAEKEAARRIIADALEAEDRTLHFQPGEFPHISPKPGHTTGENQTQPPVD